MHIIIVERVFYWAVSYNWRQNPVLSEKKQLKLSNRIVFLPYRYWNTCNPYVSITYTARLLTVAGRLNHIISPVALDSRWWFSDSVCGGLPLRGRCPHQIKHLNNYCLICCGGRGACGLIMTRLERETEPGPTHSSLLIVSPPGPQVTLTTLQSSHRRTEWQSNIPARDPLYSITSLTLSCCSKLAMLWFYLQGLSPKHHNNHRMILYSIKE